MPHQKTIRSLEELILRVRLIAFDFDGVFTDNMVYVFEDGTEAVRCFRSDGIGLQKLKRAGIKTVIISTEANPVVSARARKLKMPGQTRGARRYCRKYGHHLGRGGFCGKRY